MLYQTIDFFSSPLQALFQCIKMLKQHKINQRAKANMSTAVMQGATHAQL